jgi:hypothetical protein
MTTTTPSQPRDRLVAIDRLDHSRALATALCYAIKPNRVYLMAEVDAVIDRLAKDGWTIAHLAAPDQPAPLPPQSETKEQRRVRHLNECIEWIGKQPTPTYLTARRDSLIEILNEQRVDLLAYVAAQGTASEAQGET